MADTDKKGPKEIEIDPSHTRWFYSRPANFLKVASNIKLVFASWALIGYIAQFLLIITVINIYSDRDRLVGCGGKSYGEEASTIYDIALVLLASFHLIEWFRFTVFLIAIFLGVNFMSFWYLLKLNTLFGIAAYLVAHARRFNDAGKDCAVAGK